MNLAPVLARLVAAGVRNPGTAGSLAALGEKPPQFTPAVFIVPERDDGEDPAHITGIYDQRFRCTFLVLLYVGHSSAREGAADSALADLTAQIEGALAGLAHPDAEGKGTALVSSQLMEILDGRIVWMMRFRTTRRLRHAVTH